MKEAYVISFEKGAGIHQARLVKAENAEQAKAYFAEIEPAATVYGVAVDNVGYARRGMPCEEVPDGWTERHGETPGESAEEVKGRPGVKTKKNICPFCKYAIPQKNCGLGLVDCQCKGYGNAHQTECNSFCENSRLASLKEAAIEAIKAYDDLIEAIKECGEISESTLQRASTRSCIMQEAFAIMLDIGYDDAAEMLWKMAKKEG